MMSPQILYRWELAHFRITYGDVIAAVDNAANGELWGTGCSLGIIGTYDDSYYTHRVDFKFTGVSSI